MSRSRGVDSLVMGVNHTQEGAGSSCLGQFPGVDAVGVMEGYAGCAGTPCRFCGFSSRPW